MVSVGLVISAAKGKMLLAIRSVRDLKGLYDDVRWAVEIGGDLLEKWRTPDVPSPPEIELIEKFRDCLPLVHDEPLWFEEPFIDDWCLVAPRS